MFGDVIDDILVVPNGPVRPDTDTAASIRHSPGGSASNTAVWLASTRARVDLVAAVGAADVERHRSTFDAAGVIAHLTPHPALPTGTIVVLVEGESRSFLTERGANSALHPDGVTDAMLDRAALLHLTGYSVIDAPDAAALRLLIRRARDRGLDVSIDPGSAGYIGDFGADRFLAEVTGASILLPNLAEGRVLTGLDDPVSIAERLAESFAVVALTLGRAGVIVATGDGIAEVPAVAASVTDPTGAGDAFSAGFLAHWVVSRDAVAAAEAGVRLAARAVTVMGGRPERP